MWGVAEKRYRKFGITRGIQNRPALSESGEGHIAAKKGAVSRSGRFRGGGLLY